MRKLMSLIFTCSTTVCIAQEAPVKYDSVIQRLGREFSQDSLTRDLSIGITLNGEEWFYNFGKQQPAKHTVYEIGSITKSFVSLVLAHAVTEGKVSLQDDIRKYLPREFPALAYNDHPIRLIHLANTTSGLPDNLPSVPDTFQRTQPDSVSFIRARIERKFTPDVFMTALQNIRPDTIPGTRPRHSNAAAWLLSYILEQVYHQPIERLISQYVLDPLKMQESGFGYAEAGDNMREGYNERNKPAALLNGEFVRKIGGMRSSSSDMLKYVRYLMKAGDPQSRLTLLPTISVDAATNKLLDVYPKDTVDSRRYAVSMNWIHYHPGQGELRAFMDGGTPGYRSFMIMYPEHNMGMVFLSNRTGQEILDKMYKIVDAIFRIAKNSH